MKPFQIGERCAAYGHGWNGTRPQSNTIGRVTGTVSDIKPDVVVIDIDPKNFATVDEGVRWISYHRIQCRRLKPRAKAREWFIPEFDEMFGGIYSMEEHAKREHMKGNPPNRIVHVREVLKKRGG